MRKVEGELFEDYLHDMHITQQFALWNRKAMTDEILMNMGLEVEERFTTIHNYIDVENKMLRKGAVSAEKGEKLIIPMNMRDGSLICVGKGNEEWNRSAPHGAGRVMSRASARKRIELEDFQKSMEGIYSTTVCLDTIDEAPFAYKPVAEIMAHIGGTVDVIDQVRPLYNFKAKE